MALFITALDISFIKSLAIAIVSATISGLFLIFSTRYMVKHQERDITPKLDDIKQKVGADKREGDA